VAQAEIIPHLVDGSHAQYHWQSFLHLSCWWPSCRGARFDTTLRVLYPLASWSAARIKKRQAREEQLSV
jgi:hypothetical protein